MAAEPQVTIVGNVVGDPELKYIQNGVAVLNMRVASTPRKFDRQSNEWKDGTSLFIDTTAWRGQAEEIASRVKKGTTVMLQGRLIQQDFETKDGEKRSKLSLDIDEAAIVIPRTKQNAERAGGQTAQAPAASTAYDEDVPF